MPSDVLTGTSELAGDGDVGRRVSRRHRKRLQRGGTRVRSVIVHRRCARRREPAEAHLPPQQLLLEASSADLQKRGRTPTSSAWPGT